MSKLINDIIIWFQQPVFEKKEKKEKVIYPEFHHIQGNQVYSINVPGIDPQKLRVVNVNRKIFLFNEKIVLGKITTYDQIDRGELKVKYQFGRVTISITPNTEKFKEYEADIEFLNYVPSIVETPVPTETPVEPPATPAKISTKKAPAKQSEPTPFSFEEINSIT